MSKRPKTSLLNQLLAVTLVTSMILTMPGTTGWAADTNPNNPTNPTNPNTPSGSLPPGTYLSDAAPGTDESYLKTPGTTPVTQNTDPITTNDQKANMVLSLINLLGMAKGGNAAAVQAASEIIDHNGLAQIPAGAGYITGPNGELVLVDWDKQVAAIQDNNAKYIDAWLKNGGQDPVSYDEAFETGQRDYYAQLQKSFVGDGSVEAYISRLKAQHDDLNADIAKQIYAANYQAADYGARIQFNQQKYDETTQKVNTTVKQWQQATNQIASLKKEMDGLDQNIKAIDAKLATLQALPASPTLAAQIADLRRTREQLQNNWTNDNIKRTNLINGPLLKANTSLCGPNNKFSGTLATNACSANPPPSALIAQQQNYKDTVQFYKDALATLNSTFRDYTNIADWPDQIVFASDFNLTFAPLDPTHSGLADMATAQQDILDQLNSGDKTQVCAPAKAASKGQSLASKVQSTIAPTQAGVSFSAKVSGLPSALTKILDSANVEMGAVSAHENDLAQKTKACQQVAADVYIKQSALVQNDVKNMIAAQMAMYNNRDSGSAFKYYQDILNARKVVDDAMTVRQARVDEMKPITDDLNKLQQLTGAGGSLSQDQQDKLRALIAQFECGSATCPGLENRIQSISNPHSQYSMSLDDWSTIGSASMAWTMCTTTFSCPDPSLASTYANPNYIPEGNLIAAAKAFMPMYEFSPEGKDSFDALVTYNQFYNPDGSAKYNPAYFDASGNPLPAPRAVYNPKQPAIPSAAANGLDASQAPWIQAPPISDSGVAYQWDKTSNQWVAIDPSYKDWAPIKDNADFAAVFNIIKEDSVKMAALQDLIKGASDKLAVDSFVLSTMVPIFPDPVMVAPLKPSFELLASDKQWGATNLNLQVSGRTMNLASLPWAPGSPGAQTNLPITNQAKQLLASLSANDLSPIEVRGASMLNIQTPSLVKQASAVFWNAVDQAGSWLVGGMTTKTDEGNFGVIGGKVNRFVDQVFMGDGGLGLSGVNAPHNIINWASNEGFIPTEMTPIWHQAANDLPLWVADHVNVLLTPLAIVAPPVGAALMIASSLGQSTSIAYDVNGGFNSLGFGVSISMNDGWIPSVTLGTFYHEAAPRLVSDALALIPALGPELGTVTSGTRALGQGLLELGSNIGTKVANWGIVKGASNFISSVSSTALEALGFSGKTVTTLDIGLSASRVGLETSELAVGAGKAVGVAAEGGTGAATIASEMTPLTTKIGTAIRSSFPEISEAVGKLTTGGADLASSFGKATVNILEAYVPGYTALAEFAPRGASWVGTMAKGLGQGFGAFLDATVPLSVTAYGIGTMGDGKLTATGLMGALTAPGQALVLGVGSLLSSPAAQFFGGGQTGDQWRANAYQAILGNATVSAFLPAGAVRAIVEGIDPQAAHAALQFDAKGKPLALKAVDTSDHVVDVLQGINSANAHATLKFDANGMPVASITNPLNGKPTSANSDSPDSYVPMTNLAKQYDALGNPLIMKDGKLVIDPTKQAIGSLLDQQGAGWGAVQALTDKWAKLDSTTKVGMVLGWSSKTLSTFVDVAAFGAGSRFAGQAAETIFGSIFNPTTEAGLKATQAWAQGTTTLAMGAPMVDFVHGQVTSFQKLATNFSLSELVNYAYDVSSFAVGVGATHLTASEVAPTPGVVEKAPATPQPGVFDVSVKEVGKMVTMGVAGLILPAPLVTFTGAIALPFYQAGEQEYNQAQIAKTGNVAVDYKGQGTAAIDSLRQTIDPSQRLLVEDKIVNATNISKTAAGDFTINGVKAPAELTAAIQPLFDRQQSGNLFSLRQAPVVEDVGSVAPPTVGENSIVRLPSDGGPGGGPQGAKAALSARTATALPDAAPLESMLPSSDGGPTGGAPGAKASIPELAARADALRAKANSVADTLGEDSPAAKIAAQEAYSAQAILSRAVGEANPTFDAVHNATAELFDAKANLASAESIAGSDTTAAQRAVDTAQLRVDKLTEKAGPALADNAGQRLASGAIEEASALSQQAAETEALQAKAAHVAAELGPDSPEAQAAARDAFKARADLSSAAAEANPIHEEFHLANANYLDAEANLAGLKANGKASAGDISDAEQAVRTTAENLKRVSDEVSPFLLDTAVERPSSTKPEPAIQSVGVAALEAALTPLTGAEVSGVKATMRLDNVGAPGWGTKFMGKTGSLSDAIASMFRTSAAKTGAEPASTPDQQAPATKATSDVATQQTIRDTALAQAEASRAKAEALDQQVTTQTGKAAEQTRTQATQLRAEATRFEAEASVASSEMHLAQTLGHGGDVEAAIQGTQIAKANLEVAKAEQALANVPGGAAHDMARQQASADLLMAQAGLEAGRSGAENIATQQILQKAYEAKADLSRANAVSDPSQSAVHSAEASYFDAQADLARAKVVLGKDNASGNLFSILISEAEVSYLGTKVEAAQVALEAARSATDSAENASADLVNHTAASETSASRAAESRAGADVLDELIRVQEAERNAEPAGALDKDLQGDDAVTRLGEQPIVPEPEAHPAPQPEVEMVGDSFVAKPDARVADRVGQELALREKDLQHQELMARIDGNAHEVARVGAELGEVRAHIETRAQDARIREIERLRNTKDDSSSLSAAELSAKNDLRQQWTKERENLQDALDLARSVKNTEEIKTISDKIAAHNEAYYDIPGKAWDAALKVVDRAAAVREIRAQRAENLANGHADWSESDIEQRISDQAKKYAEQREKSAIQGAALDPVMAERQIRAQNLESGRTDWKAGEITQRTSALVEQSAKMRAESIDAINKTTIQNESSTRARISRALIDAEELRSASDNRIGLYRQQQEALNNADRAKTPAERQMYLEQAKAVGEDIARAKLTEQSRAAARTIAEVTRNIGFDKPSTADALLLAKARYEQALANHQLQMLDANSWDRVQMANGVQEELSRLGREYAEAQKQYVREQVKGKWNDLNKQKQNQVDAVRVANDAMAEINRRLTALEESTKGRDLTDIEKRQVSELAAMTRKIQFGEGLVEKADVQNLFIKPLDTKTVKAEGEQPSLESVRKSVDEALKVTEGRLESAKADLKLGEARAALALSETKIGGFINRVRVYMAEWSADRAIQNVARIEMESGNRWVHTTQNEIDVLRTALEKAGNLPADSEFTYNDGKQTVELKSKQHAIDVLDAMEHELKLRQQAMEQKDKGAGRLGLQLWLKAQQTGANLRGIGNRSADLALEAKAIDTKIAEAKTVNDTQRVDQLQRDKGAIEKHQDMMAAEREMVKVSTRDPITFKKVTETANAAAQQFKKYVTDQYSAKYWDAVHGDNSTIKSAEIGREGRKISFQSADYRNQVLKSIFGVEVKDGKGLSETQAIAMAELLSRDLLGYDKYVDARDGLIDAKNRPLEGPRNRTSGLEDYQIRMILHSLAGNVVEVAMGGGKSPALSAVFGIKALMGGEVDGHLIVADSKEIPKYSTDGKGTDAYNQYMKAMGIGEIQDGDSLYNQGKDSGYSQLKGRLKESGNKVTVFSLDVYGHLARARKEEGNTLSTVWHPNVIGVDEADVAALLRKSFNVGKPVDATAQQKADVYELYSRISQNDEPLQRIKLSDYAGAQRDGMFAYTVDRQGKIIYTDAVLNTIAQRAESGTEFTPKHVEDILRAIEDVRGKSNIVVMDGEVHKSSLKEGFQFQTRDQSSFYQIAAVFESKSQAGITAKTLKAGEIIPEKLAVGTGIGLTTHGSEATVSEAFTHVAGRDILVFGASGTLTGAESIARMVYGADKAVTVKGADYNDYQFSALAVSNGRVGDRSIAEFVAEQAGKSWRTAGTARGFLGIFADEGSLQNSLYKFFENEITTRLDGASAADALSKLNSLKMQAELSENLGRIGTKEISVDSVKDRGQSFMDLARKNGGVIGDIASRVEVIDSFTASSAMENIAARTGLHSSNASDPLAVFATVRAGRALNFKGDVNLAVVGAEKFDQGDLLQILGRTGRMGASTASGRFESNRYVLADIAGMRENTDLVSRLNTYAQSNPGISSLKRINEYLTAMEKIPATLKNGEIISSLDLVAAIKANAAFRLDEETANAASFRLSSEVVTKLAKEPLGWIQRNLDPGSSDISVLEKVQTKLQEGGYDHSRNYYEEGKFKSPEAIAEEMFMSGLSQAERVWRDIRDNTDASIALRAEAAARLTDILMVKAGKVNGGENGTFAGIDSSRSVRVAGQVADVVKELGQQLLPSESTTSSVVHQTVVAEAAIQKTIDGLRPPEFPGMGSGGSRFGGDTDGRPSSTSSTPKGRPQSGGSADGAVRPLDDISRPQAIPLPGARAGQPVGQAVIGGLAAAVAPSIAGPSKSVATVIPASPAAGRALPVLSRDKVLAAPTLYAYQKEARALRSAGADLPPLMSAVAAADSLGEIASLFYSQAGVQAPTNGAVTSGTIGQWTGAIVSNDNSVVRQTWQTFSQATKQTASSGWDLVKKDKGDSSGFKTGMKAIGGLVIIAVSPLKGVISAAIPNSVNSSQKLRLLMDGASGFVDTIPLLKTLAEKSPNVVSAEMTDQMIEAVGQKAGKRGEQLMNELRAIRAASDDAIGGPVAFRPGTSVSQGQLNGKPADLVAIDPSVPESVDTALQMIRHAANGGTAVSIQMSSDNAAVRKLLIEQATQALANRPQGAQVHIVNSAGTQTVQSTGQKVTLTYKAGVQVLPTVPKRPIRTAMAWMGSRTDTQPTLRQRVDSLNQLRAQQQSLRQQQQALLIQSMRGQKPADENAMRKVQQQAANLQRQEAQARRQLTAHAARTHAAVEAGLGTVDVRAASFAKAMQGAKNNEEADLAIHDLLHANGMERVQIGEGLGLTPEVSQTIDKQKTVAVAPAVISPADALLQAVEANLTAVFGKSNIAKVMANLKAHLHAAQQNGAGVTDADRVRVAVQDVIKNPAIIAPGSSQFFAVAMLPALHNALQEVFYFTGDGQAVAISDLFSLQLGIANTLAQAQENLKPGDLVVLTSPIMISTADFQKILHKVLMAHPGFVKVRYQLATGDQLVSYQAGIKDLDAKLLEEHQQEIAKSMPFRTKHSLVSKAIVLSTTLTLAVGAAFVTGGVSLVVAALFTGKTIAVMAFPWWGAALIQVGLSVVQMLIGQLTGLSDGFGGIAKMFKGAMKPKAGATAQPGQMAKGLLGGVSGMVGGFGLPAVLGLVLGIYGFGLTIVGIMGIRMVGAFAGQAVGGIGLSSVEKLWTGQDIKPVNLADAQEAIRQAKGREFRSRWGIKIGLPVALTGLFIAALPTGMLAESAHAGMINAPLVFMALAALILFHSETARGWIAPQAAINLVNTPMEDSASPKVVDASGVSDMVPDIAGQEAKPSIWTPNLIQKIMWGSFGVGAVATLIVLTPMFPILAYVAPAVLLAGGVTWILWKPAQQGITVRRQESKARMSAIDRQMNQARTAADGVRPTTRFSVNLPQNLALTVNENTSLKLSEMGTENLLLDGVRSQVVKGVQVRIYEKGTNPLKAKPVRLTQMIAYDEKGMGQYAGFSAQVTNIEAGRTYVVELVHEVIKFGNDPYDVYQTGSTGIVKIFGPSNRAFTESESDGMKLVTPEFTAEEAAQRKTHQDKMTALAQQSDRENRRYSAPWYQHLPIWVPAVASVVVILGAASYLGAGELALHAFRGIAFSPATIFGGLTLGGIGLFAILSGNDDLPTTNPKALGSAA